MYCGKCGNQIYPGEKFCGNCGSPIENWQTATQPTQPTPQPIEKPITPYIKKKNDDDKKFIIAAVTAIIVIVLVPICIGVFFTEGDPVGGEDFYNSGTTETTEYQTDNMISETETTITTTESTTKKETTTAPTTTKPAASSVYLEATSEELNQLANFLGIVGTTKGPLRSNYDSKKINYKNFVENYLFHTSGYSFTYNKYFNTTTYNYDETPDPLNRFMAVDDEWKTGEYYKYSKSNIEWIMKNIYNIPSSTISNFSASAIEDDDTYYKDGYIYQEKHVGFGSSGLYIEVDKYTRLDDGRYSVEFTEMNEFSGEAEGKGTAIVSMKNIDGKRYWSLHSIS